MSFYYLEEDYVRRVIPNEVTDGLHPPVDGNVLAGPDVVGHELYLLLAVLNYKKRRYDQEVDLCGTARTVQQDQINIVNMLATNTRV